MHKLTIFPAITRDHRSLERYLSELKHIPLIEAEEEIRLARRIRRGDRRALEQLVRANLRFVVSVAKQYQHIGLPLPDLISEGNIGLVMAAERFDETRGFKFISYAVWWIRKVILEAITEQSRLVRLPGRKIRDMARLRRVTAEMEQELDREPTVEELAEALDWQAIEVRRLLELMPRRLSIHAPLEMGESPTLLDVLADRSGDALRERRKERESRRAFIDQLLARLSKRERQILRLYFGVQEGWAEGKPMSCEEIGKRLGLGVERVKVLKNRALLKLRVSRV